ncbi:MAG TPA: hypothetical protein DEF51_48150 [Myxococcales bacterium]|nr:hypothetical protein [Myxococcales bacterium]
MDRLDPPSRRQLDEHLSGCAECAAMAASVGSVSDFLDGSTELPSNEIEERLVLRVATDLHKPSRYATWISSAVFGLALAALGVILTATRDDAHHGSWAQLTLCGGVWAVAFSGAVHLIRGAVAKQRSAIWGLTGLGIAVGTVLICPLPAGAVACEACRSLSGGIGLRESIAVFTLTGLLFGGLLTWAMQSAHEVGPGGRTGLAAIAVIGAVGPALYLTCTPFSVGSLLGLGAGVLGGSLASAVGGRVSGSQGR